MALRVATDIGGTFTDAVVMDGSGNVRIVKSNTTPDSFDRGVTNAMRKARINYSEISFFVHGTTIVINALTERKGVKTGLITTRGFRDVLEIARGNTPDIFNSYYRKPKPFIPRYLRMEVSERLTHSGEVLNPLNERDIVDALDDLKVEGVEAIAISFLHAYVNQRHEKQALDIVRRHWPEVAVVASHQVSREWREYERTNTAALSAYVLPPARKYLDNLTRTLQVSGVTPAPFIMQSNGGISTVRSARENPISMVESGPVGGILGALAYGRLIAEENIIALDIGGTTAKCSLIHDGEIRISTDYYIERDQKSAGYPIKTPVIDIVEIGNGGGSIAWVDAAGSLHVGPQSAGSEPGPVAYGKGGTEPTATDANLFAARINPEFFVGGDVSPDIDALNASFEKLASTLDVTAADAARGVLRIANANMTNALKLVSLNRGFDPRDFVLMAFGGGGAMHATALAEELRIPRVIIPPYSGVFSAWGMLMIDLRRDLIRTAITPLDDSGWAIIEDHLQRMRAESLAGFDEDEMQGANVIHQCYLDMRYLGQEHTVKVALDADVACVEELAQRFHDVHEKEYTYRLDNDVEVVNYHVVSFGLVDKPEVAALEHADSSDASIALKGRRTVDFDIAGVHEANIYDRGKLSPSMVVTGPAIIEETSTTTVVMPGNHVEVDRYGGLHISIEMNDGRES